MVIRRLLTLAFLILWSLPAFAQSTLTAEPNRTELYETETLTLTVKGSMELSFSLGGLFDFNMSNLPSPDTSELESSFKILSRNQQYSVSSVNGQTTGDITWTYHLAPLSSGELTIPALTFKDAQSNPHTITVKPGAPTSSGTSGRQAFIELSTDKDSVYVQEQLVLTVRLYFSGNLLRGELSAPSHPNALIESLGKQREYRRFRDGREYQVVERRYAIFPQQAGNFSIDPIEFQGQVRDATGRLQFLTDRAPFFDMLVKAPPASFSGNTWLPARGLTLTESGISDSLLLQPGDSVTRTLTLTADGLTAEALPSPSQAGTDRLKSYPEQPKRSTEHSPEGLTGTLISESALVGVSPGTTTLPEVRISWWDTNTDSEKLAVIPARTITVAGAAAVNSVTDNNPVAADNTTHPSGNTDTSMQPITSNVWLWLAVIMGAGWLITAMLWAKQRQKHSQTETLEHDTVEASLFAEVVAAAKKGDVSLLSVLPRWMNHRVPGETFNSVNDVLRWAEDDSLCVEVQRLERRAFGDSRQVEASPWEGEKLIDALQRLRAHKSTATSTGQLPPLYPDTLTDRH